MLLIVAWIGAFAALLAASHRLSSGDIKRKAGVLEPSLQLGLHDDRHRRGRRISPGLLAPADAHGSR